MITSKNLENLDYNGLLELLGTETKEFTAALADDLNRGVDDERIYFLSMLIKEIEMRENAI